MRWKTTWTWSRPRFCLTQLPHLPHISEGLMKRNLRRGDMRDMSLGQLQVITNDLHSQIQSVYMKLARHTRCFRYIFWHFLARRVLQVLTRSWCSCFCWETSCTWSRTPCWWTSRISPGEPAPTNPFHPRKNGACLLDSLFSPSFLPNRHSHQRHQAEKAISK